MKKYQTPTLESIYFDVNNCIMKNDGYDPGDMESENPWKDLIDSAEDSNSGLSFNA